jgi:hypothetical protein
MMRWDVIHKLRETIEQMQRDFPTLTVKVMVSGHSLGAAMASLAMYDLTCNNHLGQTPDGLITFGHPITFFGEKSMKAYKQTVPVSKRMRVNACSRQVEHVRMRNRDPDSKIYDDALGQWGGAANPAHMCPEIQCCETLANDLADEKFGTVGGWCKDLRLGSGKANCKDFRKDVIKECDSENTIARDCMSARAPQNMFASCDAVGTDFPKTAMTAMIKALPRIMSMSTTSFLLLWPIVGPLLLVAMGATGATLGASEAALGTNTTAANLLLQSLVGGFGGAVVAPVAAIGHTFVGLATFLLAIFSPPFNFKGYFQTDDDDFQAAWVRKVHPSQGGTGVVQTGSCFGLPNQLLCHLLDAYSEGMRRHNKYNGNICAKIDDSPDAVGRLYQLTPYDDLYGDDPVSVDNNFFHLTPQKFQDASASGTQYGANQLGYPAQK